MKASQVRDLSLEELQNKELDLHQELVNLRVQAVLGQIENPVRLRYMRRELARVKTILREGEFSLEQKGAEN